MTHLRLALTVACLLAISTGCRMCASKFDYCGPTVAGGCGEQCGLCGVPRAGSILTGAGQNSDQAVTVTETEPTPAGQLGRRDFEAPIMPRQMVDGVEIEGVIISIEEGKVEETTEPQTLSVSDAKPTPAPAAESQGWSTKH